MTAIYDNLRECDCICQFTKKGEIVPIKIQFTDDDCNNEIYKIHGYKHISTRNGIMVFTCKIMILGKLQFVTLIYNSNESKWRLRPGA